MIEESQRGFIAGPQQSTIQTANGQSVWDFAAYTFVDGLGDRSDTIHPDLLRLAQANQATGLFKVCERIYQVRGFDLANISFIEGETGVIVIDALTTTETAQAALELYYSHRPRKPIVVVIYTHCHVDHYGGIKGLVTEEEVKSGRVQILAPEGFLEYAVSENIMAGNAMSRRAQYMYGLFLPKNAQGHVGNALGRGLPFGTITLLAPTEIIRTTGHTRIIDGVEMTFQMAQNTEAPAEMLIHFPQFQALCAAEIVSQTMHNLYTLRGTEIRDAVAWWKAIDLALELFLESNKTEVVFAGHHWPTWEKEQIVPLFQRQRDLYKYLHDQSLHLMNQGYTMLEVAEMMQLPLDLSMPSHYGSVSHNAKGIYQRYLGYYSSHPSDLHPLPPLEAAKNYIAYMGGTSQIIEKAQISFERGEYRWVAEVMKHVVFADAGNLPARSLLAASFEQLGYQTENATWRNEYLMAALELRHGVPTLVAPKADSPDVLRAMTLEMCLDYLGVRLNGSRAEGKTILLHLSFPQQEKFVVHLQHSVLLYRNVAEFPSTPSADVVLHLSREAFQRLFLGSISLEQALQEGIGLQGSVESIEELLSLFEHFPSIFPIVTL